MTMRELLGSLQANLLIDESRRFMADQEGYLKKVVTMLEENARNANQFLKDTTRLGGGEFLFGMHWIFTLIDNLQRLNGVEDWLEQTLTLRDREFYKTQAGLAAAKFGQFAKRAMAIIDEQSPFLKDHIMIVASNMGDAERSFRIGALFGIEILLRFEGHDSETAAKELRQVIH